MLKICCTHTFAYLLTVQVVARRAVSEEATLLVSWSRGLTNFSSLIYSTPDTSYTLYFHILLHVSLPPPPSTTGWNIGSLRSKRHQYVMPVPRITHAVRDNILTCAQSLYRLIVDLQLSVPHDDGERC